MYGIVDYGAMLTDRARLDAYAAALREVIRPGMVVLDVGTGPGVMALDAARLGARVWAVDLDDSVGLGRELAARNGLGERVTFHHGPVESLDLPAPADIVVSDLRGVVPVATGHLDAIIDVRRRLLAPNGRLIPALDRLHVAPVHVPKTWQGLAGPWSTGVLDLDLASVHHLAINNLTKVRLDADALLAPSRVWSELDYHRVDAIDVAGETAFEDVHGTVHGWLLFFDTELVPGIGFSSGPGGGTEIYGQIFLPLPEPLEVERDHRLEVALRADRVGDEYVWTWKTRHRGAGADRSFDQSTFYGRPLVASGLERRRGSFQPRCSVEGEIERFVLDRFDGHATVDAIATALRDAFPDRIPDHRTALTRVGDVSRRFGDGSSDS
ncbi:MAG: methyltransferase domain-containing protein [Acidobacteriota bacterium]